MAENEGQVPEQNAEGQEPPAAPPPPEPSGEPENETPDAGRTSEDYERELAELRRENAKHRTRARDAEQEAGKLREQVESDAERQAREAKEAKERAEAAERRLSTTLTRVAVGEAAVRKDVTDPATVFALIQSEGVAIDTDEDGNPVPESVEAAVDSVLKGRDFLIRAKGQAPAGAGEGAPGNDRAPREETDDERRARLYGGRGSTSVFDRQDAERRGGGLIIGRGVEDAPIR